MEETRTHVWPWSPPMEHDLCTVQWNLRDTHHMFWAINSFQVPLSINGQTKGQQSVWGLRTFSKPYSFPLKSEGKKTQWGSNEIFFSRNKKTLKFSGSRIICEGGMGSLGRSSYVLAESGWGLTFLLFFSCRHVWQPGYRKSPRSNCISRTKPRCHKHLTLRTYRTM